MPFQMKIQPCDDAESTFRTDAVVKAPVLKSRLKRLFDRPFNSVLRSSTADKPANGVASVEFEPSSVCLDKMVQNFIEENNEKQIAGAGAIKCGRNHCSCFHGNSNDSSDDEFDFSDAVTANSSCSDPSDILKSLVPCASVSERNLLADTSKIVEKHTKTCKRKDHLRKSVADGLSTLGYNASVCKSKWEKSSSIPAGEYEYIDVITDCERLFIDIDFRSEFVIARSTSNYRSILQCLPLIFVGRSDRLLQIVSIASEAARQSLKKKGMHIAPWRKSEYMKSKWFSPHNRLMSHTSPDIPEEDAVQDPDESTPKPEPKPQIKVPEVPESEVGELDLIFGEKTLFHSDSEVPVSPAKEVSPATAWQLPEFKRKSSLERGNKGVVTGLAYLLQEKL